MKIEQSPITSLMKNDLSADIAKEAKLKKACNDFEAIFIKQMLTSMRKSIPKGGLFENGYAQETFQAMQDDEMAKSMAHGKGLGIANVLYDQISGKISQTTHKGQSNDTIK